MSLNSNLEYVYNDHDALAHALTEVERVFGKDIVVKGPGGSYNIFADAAKGTLILDLIRAEYHKYQANH